MNKKIFFLFLLLIDLNGYSFNFYTTKKIPDFSAQEQIVFDQFEISFKFLKETTETNIHNSQVLKIIKKHGNKWKKALENKLDSINSIEAKKFIVRLFEEENESWPCGQKIKFHHNGVISERRYFVQHYVKKRGQLRIRMASRPYRYDVEYSEKGKCVNREKHLAYPFV